MERTNGLFAAKLKELEREYGQLQRGLHHLEDGRKDGQRELDEIWREYEEQLARLERSQTGHGVGAAGRGHFSQQKVVFMVLIL